MNSNTRALVVVARTIWSAAPDFGWAAAFLISWLRPYTFGETAVHHLVFVMLLEFIVVHSTGFFGAIGAKDEPMRSRAFMYTVLALFYCIFAGSFALTYGGPWPIYAFVMLTIGKLPNTVLRPPDAAGQNIVIVNWAAMTALYLAGVFITAVLTVPSYGVTPEAIAKQQFTVGGLWTEEPYRVMAFGAFYFTGMGIVSILNEIIPILLAKRKAKKDAYQGGWLPKP
jgi:hypothetical protein